MSTADDQVVLKPGSDAPSHIQNLQENVAIHLSDATGKKFTPSQVAPVLDQHPLDDKIDTETSLEEIIAGEKGRPRTEPSKNFLKMLFQRLKKQNPQKEVSQEP